MSDLTTAEANDLLPQAPTKAPVDPRRLKYLLIGPPKWGKTSLGCSVDDSLLLAFEEGHAFHETHKIIIVAWDRPYAERKEGWLTDDDGNRMTGLEEAVEAIITSDRFKFIVIDTADMAAKMCLDYHYKKYNVNHASDAGDYGKGWDLCLTQPFRRQIGQLMKAGRGVCFITHTNIIEKKVGQATISREETTLPSQVQKFLHTQADVIMHGKFGKKRAGMKDRDRIVIMDGSNEILAGSRVRGLHVPAKFIVDPEHPWQQWSSFFTDPKAVDKAEADYNRLVLGGRESEQEAEAQIAAEAEPEPSSTKSSTNHEEKAEAATTSGSRRRTTRR